ncbi:TetR/AcrR family transcriptional regulator [Streptomyces sp. bgisy154]|uniref:TetR/AcrR family transcriptional regulator n=1 Tax=Streptomyces sp. bgisy154 TaxID=3413794 RepID=UPI003D721548
MTRARPMRADARRNHERLLTAAVEAFARYGERASLDDIAKRAGVGSGTLYRHFPTRQALLEAAYTDRVEALAARADDLARRLPPGEALREWLYELCVGSVQVRGLKSLLGSAVTDGGGPVDSPCGTAVTGAATRLLDAARREGTVRADLTPVELLRLAHAVTTACELGHGEPGAVRRYLTLVTQGLGPTAARG